MKNKLRFKIILYIVISSIIIGFTYNSITDDGIPVIRKGIKTQLLSEMNENESGGIILINLSQAIKFYNQGTIFIDSRDQWEFSDSHIRGAINLPEFSFTPSDPILEKLNKKDDFVIYCDGIDCDISKRLAAELLKLGFENCFVFVGGISAWNEAELPIVKGTNNE